MVVAEHQTAGRGRLDRVWETPARVVADVLGAAAPDVPTRRVAVAAAARPGYAVQAALRRPAARRRPEVAQRRPCVGGPQGRRHPGRAGRDRPRARRPWSGSGSTSPDARRAAGRAGHLARARDRRAASSAPACWPGASARSTALQAWSPTIPTPLRRGVRRRVRRRSAATVDVAPARPATSAVARRSTSTRPARWWSGPATATFTVGGRRRRARPTCRQ